MHNLMVQVRRLIRWYLTPSGLLLATALSLFVIALLWPPGARWIGGAGVVALGVFLPYRFSRQQGLAQRHSDALGEWIKRVQNEASHNASMIRASIDEVRGEQSLQPEAAETQLQKLVAQQNGKLTLLSQTQAADREQLSLVVETAQSLSDRFVELQAQDEVELLKAKGQLSALSEQLASDSSRGATETDNTQAITHALDGALAREVLSGSTTAASFQYVGRALTGEDLAELSSWCSTLGLTVNDRALSYMAHEVRVTEDALLGRMAGSLGSAVLRALVLRSLDTRAPHVLEIGSLFGVSIAALDRSTFGVFDTVTFTAIDPLDGFYKTAELDIVTGVPVSQPVFDENMRRAGIDGSRLKLVRHLSTDEAAIKAVEDASVDMLFIDGDHSRYGVECDFRNFVGKVRPAGFVVFDDYRSKAWPDVEQFVDEVVMQRDDLVFVGAGMETAVFRIVAR